MKKIQCKLRSRTGASMLLALVFLLFCSFIGGSVLVSATANAYRVAQVAEQQDFLNQRSAALLLGDELQLEPGQQFRLTVVKADRSVQQVTVGGGGVVTPVGEPKPEKIITFQLMTNDPQITPMQRLMLETTVWRYLQNNLGSDEYYVQLDGFPVANLGAFLYKSPGVSASDAGNNMYLVKVNKEDEPVEGTMTVTGTMDSTVEGISNFPTYTANFSSGKGEELYDFHVDFGEFSQLRLTMGAFSGTTDPITVKTPASEGHMPDIPFANRNESNKVQIEVTSIITQTSISWDDPMVEKGGAEA